MLANSVNSRICEFLDKQEDFHPGVVLIDGLPGEGAKRVISKIIGLNSCSADDMGNAEV